MTPDRPTPPPALQFADIASRLRDVQEAYRGFLTLWVAEKLSDEVDAMQQLLDDLDDQLDAPKISFVTNRTLLHRQGDLDDERS